MSPCTGQVTHALLTRPPLSHHKIIRRISQGASFDLHVLGTPPAFILSQDQTLKNNKMSHPVSRTTGPITVSFSGFELCSLPWILLPTSLASGPHSIELNVRGCFVIQLSTCSVLSRSVLLPRKLLYFTIVLRICQELFSSFLKIFTFSIRPLLLKKSFLFS